ncbi:MAG: U32 family peptidase [Planctomycetales bacterium]|nr:U32 family peptidase [Planctomycetales bacterium]
MNKIPGPIELMAPARDWECARAAVENGAGAIYFGLQTGFNARARAKNFHLAELPELMSMLHRQGVKGYITLNTLVFTDELATLESHLRQLAAAQVDAVIVQDIGAVRLIHELCPELPIHASTQMTLTNAVAVNMLQQLSVSRVVLARELSVSEIEKIGRQTTMPLEAFVHGALCVAYSGQCLTSESLGGRSANRGQCAQACRLPYQLICDGQLRELGDEKYLLSPQDLAAYELVPQLLAAGVSSLKIEGRLKTPEYVALTCQAYNEAMQCASEGRDCELPDDRRRDLELVFSRGLSPGWLEGCDHQRLVPATSSSKRGLLLGTIVRLQGDGLLIDLTQPLAAGDGIVIEGDRIAGTEIGGRVFSIYVGSQRMTAITSAELPQHGDPLRIEVRLQAGIFTAKNYESLRQNLPGRKLWKTDDPQLTRRLRKSFDDIDPTKRVPINLELTVAIGQPLKMTCEYAGQKIEVCTTVGEEPFIPEKARKHPVSIDALQTQFARLGGTVYRLGTLQAHITGEPMVPHSVLGELRKNLVAALDRMRLIKPWTCQPVHVAQKMLVQSKSVDALKRPYWRTAELESQGPILRVLCRSLSHVHMALAAGVQDLIADLHDLRECRQAVALARGQGARIELATLRILKPGEEGLFRALEKHGGDSWLVRNLAALKFASDRNIPATADFSLNATNPLTVEQLMRWGADVITTSYDLNREQLLELVAHCPVQHLEIVIHQHMPMFHMEHCVFCNVLSPGKNKSDCGRPCDQHQVELRDRVGVDHILHADIGCRNTLYNGVPQSGAEAVNQLILTGVRRFRIELLRNATQEEVERIISLYRGLLAGQLQGSDVWKELRAHNRVGVTRGTLEQPRNPLAIL